MGFIITGDGGRVEGCERTWAAGDGIVSPLKLGGLAAHQARWAARDIAARHLERYVVEESRPAPELPAEPGVRVEVAARDVRDRAARR